MKRGIGEKEVVQHFLSEEQSRGRRKQGLDGLRSRVPHYFRYLNEKQIDFESVGVREAGEYQGWLLAYRKKDGGRYSYRTVNSYLVAVTAFYDYLLRHERILSNPFKSIKRVRCEKTIPDNLLDEKETDRLLDELSSFTSPSAIRLQTRRYRIHVLCELLYSTGLRISEAASLKESDIDFEQSLIRVRDGKGGKERICFMNSFLCSALKIYVREIRPLLLTGLNKEKKTLLLSGKDRLISVSRYELSSLVTLESVEHPPTCHTFRHLLGYHLLRSGADLRSIQSILGHSALRNTEIYTHVDKEDLKAVLDQYHPRQWKR